MSLPSPHDLPHVLRMICSIATPSSTPHTSRNTHPIFHRWRHRRILSPADSNDRVIGLLPIVQTRHARRLSPLWFLASKHAAAVVEQRRRGLQSNIQDQTVAAICKQHRPEKQQQAVRVQKFLFASPAQNNRRNSRRRSRSAKRKTATGPRHSPRCTANCAPVFKRMRN